MRETPILIDSLPSIKRLTKPQVTAHRDRSRVLQAQVGMAMVIAYLCFQVESQDRPQKRQLDPRRPSATCISLNLDSTRGSRPTST